MKDYFHTCERTGWFVLSVLCSMIVVVHTTHAQSSGVQPTPVPGSNSVSFDAGTNSYRFFHNGILRYEYSIASGITTYGGTLNVLKAFADNGSSFLPSNFGGISAILGGVEKRPWDSGVTFSCLQHQFLTGDTVLAGWAMIANGIHASTHTS